ncbi:hypothetical protein [Chelativorans sp. Marseille-P2723]|uniref:hypothetical protein n=1 Tax=Chelativorans sp. Marseille-P2723 TaxID=2709133 RepID=UPI00156FFF22|nr:hypothetical protein [Chelativorans sp. Marseille-P2723]
MQTPCDLAYKAAAVTSMADDFLERDSIVEEGDNRLVLILAAEKAVILILLGCRQKLRADTRHTDTPPDFSR